MLIYHLCSTCEQKNHGGGADCQADNGGLDTISQRSVRKKMEKDLAENQIGGRGLNVEIDKFKLFQQKCNRDKVLQNKAGWAVGGICQQTREAFVVQTERRGMNDLVTIICRVCLS